MFNKSKEPICPLIRKECIKHGCKFWVTIHGKNPQTGADLSSSDCVMVMTPLLLIENNKEVRQSAAATESARNEFVNMGHHIGNAVMLAAASTQSAFSNRSDGENSNPLLK